MIDRPNSQCLRAGERNGETKLEWEESQEESAGEDRLAEQPMDPSSRSSVPQRLRKRTLEMAVSGRELERMLPRMVQPLMSQVNGFWNWSLVRRLDFPVSGSVAGRSIRLKKVALMEQMTPHLARPPLWDRRFGNDGRPIHDTHLCAGRRPRGRSHYRPHELDWLGLRYSRAPSGRIYGKDPRCCERVFMSSTATRAMRTIFLLFMWGRRTVLAAGSNHTSRRRTSGIGVWYLSPALTA